MWSENKLVFSPKSLFSRSISECLPLVLIIRSRWISVQMEWNSFSSDCKPLKVWSRSSYSYKGRHCMWKKSGVSDVTSGYWQREYWLWAHNDSFNDFVLWAKFMEVTNPKATAVVSVLLLLWSVSPCRLLSGGTTFSCWGRSHSLSSRLKVFMMYFTSCSPTEPQLLSVLLTASLCSPPSISLTNIVCI